MASPNTLNNLSITSNTTSRRSPLRKPPKQPRKYPTHSAQTLNSSYWDQRIMQCLSPFYLTGAPVHTSITRNSQYINISRLYIYETRWNKHPYFILLLSTKTQCETRYMAPLHGILIRYVLNLCYVYINTPRTFTIFTINVSTVTRSRALSRKHHLYNASSVTKIGYVCADHRPRSWFHSQFLIWLKCFDTIWLILSDSIWLWFTNSIWLSLYKHIFLFDLQLSHNPRSPT